MNSASARDLLLFGAGAARECPTAGTGRRAIPAKRTGGQRASDSWSGGDICPGLGAASRAATGTQQHALGGSGQVPAGRVTLFDLAWGAASRTASDTGKTHWESASKRQLVGLRCPTRLGDGAPAAIDTRRHAPGGQQIGTSWTSYTIQPSLGADAPAAIDTGSTHWGAAGKCQLVKLRYSIWLGGWLSGRRATPAKRSGGQRASDSWSGYAIRPGWGMAPRVASDTGETHKGTAGRRQLVRLRYPSRLGDGAPAAIDTGDTHKGTAGKRQLVGLRCPTQLGGWRPGSNRHRRHAQGDSG